MRSPLFVALLLMIGSAGGSMAATSSRVETPSAQYERIFRCLHGSGYAGRDLNRGSWPRILVMLRRRGSSVTFFGRVYRSASAAKNDYLGSKALLARMGVPGVRAIHQRWLSARYVVTAAATNCVLRS